MIFDPITIIQGNDTWFAVPLKISTEPGAQVIAISGSEQVSGVVDDYGIANLILPKGGTWTVNAGKGDTWATPKEIEIPLEYSLAFNLQSRLPAGYTELEYIQTVPGARTNINVKISTGIRLILDVEPLAYTTTSYAHTYFASAYQTSSSKTYAILVYLDKGNSGGNGVFCSFYNGGGEIKNKISSDYTLRRMLIDWDMSTNTISLDGSPVDITVNNPSSDFFVKPAFYIPNTANTSDKTTTAVKVYSAKFYTDGVIQADLIPCKDSNGVAGLYDVVQNVFRKSDVSNLAFVAGPEV